MVEAIFTFIRSQIIRLMFLDWRSKIIAHEVHCHAVIIYCYQKNLFMYENIFASRRRRIDASKKITKIVENSLIEYLKKLIFLKKIKYFDA